MIFSKKHGIFTWIRSFGHECQKSEASRFSTELLLLLCVEPVGNSAYFFCFADFWQFLRNTLLSTFLLSGGNIVVLVGNQRLVPA